MKSLNKKAIARFMRMVDQMAGRSELTSMVNGKNPLTLSLVATDIFSNSINSVGNLYKLAYTDLADKPTASRAMMFLVFDRRIEKNNEEAVQIFPVWYQNDFRKTEIEIVTIVNNTVKQINYKAQQECILDANHWLKKLEEIGYIQEIIPKAATINELVCICGNNSQFDGFDYTNREGFTDVVAEIGRTHCICRSCYRVIDLSTFKVVEKRKRVTYSQPILDINKPLIDLSAPEKAKLLHVLCPDIMRGFLTFVNDIAQQVIEVNEKTTHTALNETLSPTAWTELAKNISQTITTSFNRLVEDSDLFAKSLFTGHSKTFLFHCLEEYMPVCENTRLTRGIEFIFDL